MKRGIKRGESTTGVCAYLVCECTRTLRLPIVGGRPLLAYACGCGREYDFNGWLLTGGAEQRKPEPHARLRNFQLALLDADSETFRLGGQ